MPLAFKYWTNQFNKYKLQVKKLMYQYYIRVKVTEENVKIAAHQFEALEHYSSSL